MTRGWFHAAAWLGLVATAYTNYQAAPTPDLQVGYLAVPVLLAFVSEGLIRSWTGLPARTRRLLVALVFVLVSVSYEHFVHMILVANGTPFAAWAGGAAIDATIFGCILATCAVPAVPERSVLVVAPEQNTGTEPEQPEHVLAAVPEQVALIGTEQNTGTEQNVYTASSERRPEQNRTSTRRRQNDRDALAILEREFGQKEPAIRDAAAVLSCGASRAERLIKLRRESLGGTQV